MKSSHLLFLLGLAFHRVTCDKEKTEESSNSAARGIAPPPSISTPHVPYDVEVSVSYREYLSWFNLEVIGWITRRNTLSETILGDALRDEPALLAYFLDPDNTPYLRNQVERKFHPAPAHEVDHDVRKSNIRRKRQVLNKRTPQCMVQKPAYPKEQEEEERELPIFEAYTLPPSLLDDCGYVDNVDLYPKYLVCNSETMTTIPRLPNEKLDLFELNSTKVANVPKLVFENLEITTVRLIQNALETLDPEAFLGIRKTKLVDISYNPKLSWIWFDSCFLGLNEVSTLKLDGNQINFEGFNDLYLEVDPGSSLSAAPPVLPKLTSLSLKENPLVYIPKTLFAPLQLSPVRMLILQDCQLEEIHPDALSYFPNLLWLFLSDNPRLKDNLILPMRNLHASGANLMTLDLARTGISGEPPLEVLGLFANSLETLELRGNSFPTLGPESFPASMPALTSLNLADCGITSLAEGVFESMPKLEALMLNANRFKTVPAPIGTLRNLLALDLSDNNAEQENGGVYPMEIKPYTFQKLELLEELVLTNTYLRDPLKEEHFYGLSRLHTLYLNRCGLTQIEDFAFKSTHSLLRLNLAQNGGLRTPNANTFYGLGALEILYLNSTKFTIPQVNRPMSPDAVSPADPFPKVNTTGMVRHPEGDGGGEVDFVTFGGTLMATLDPGQEEDPGQTALRPFRYLGHLTTLYLSDNEIKTLHPTLFADLPHLHKLDLTENNIQAWSERVFRNNTVLAELHLSENDFHSFTDAMLEDFCQVPEIDGTRAKVIDLRDNAALRCDLGTCKLKAGIEQADFELSDWEDVDSYQCRDMATDLMLNIRDLAEDFCTSFGAPIVPTPNTTTSSTEKTRTTESGEWPSPRTTPEPADRSPESEAMVGFGGVQRTIVILIGTGIGIVAVLIFMYLKRAQFRLFWFGLKLNVMRESTRKKGSGSGRSEDKYDYDVFISYSQHNSDFIQELVPELEGTGKFLPYDHKGAPQVSDGITFVDMNFDSASTCSSTVNMIRDPDDEVFRVCLHLRDFQVGAPITENIIECVDRSRKVLIVISGKYLESQWCLFEMNLAYHRLVEGRRSSIVLVLLEPIPVKERSKVLSHLMKSRTYLEWPKAQGQIHKELFWRRLKAALSSDESNC